MKPKTRDAARVAARVACPAASGAAARVSPVHFPCAFPPPHRGCRRVLGKLLEAVQRGAEKRFDRLRALAQILLRLRPLRLARLRARRRARAERGAHLAGFGRVYHGFRQPGWVAGTRTGRTAAPAGPSSDPAISPASAPSAIALRSRGAPSPSLPSLSSSSSEHGGPRRRAAACEQRAPGYGGARTLLGGEGGTPAGGRRRLGQEPREGRGSPAWSAGAPHAPRAPSAGAPPALPARPSGPLETGRAEPAPGEGEAPIVMGPLS